MSAAPYPDKPACLAFELGQQLTDILGQPVPEELHAHLAECLSCQLEREAFEHLERHAVALGYAFERRMEAAIAAALARREKTCDPV